MEHNVSKPNKPVNYMTRKFTEELVKNERRMHTKALCNRRRSFANSLIHVVVREHYADGEIVTPGCKIDRLQELWDLGGTGIRYGNNDLPVKTHKRPFKKKSNPNTKEEY